ncbi:homocysteine S-methyltransferase [Pedococcus sp. 5OH_020]|uniref:homocysteine S-methyltransferase n=1 Tax=Pedococcus sp. 5OH_020 TaxID=2989814 RepID=UPI0022E9F1CD|nr:homocysteine S-methyltransferase [Pedococcus sp. 5OH_020]
MIAEPPHRSDDFSGEREPQGEADRVIVLDGGLSNALEARGHDLSDALWTARLLGDAPEEIAEVHRAYYDAGARVATTASYQASVPGFARAGLDRADAESLIVHSVVLAVEVRESLVGDGLARWVAASVGPYGAMLADGSEYRGRYGVSRAELREFHGPRMELLASAGPDFLAVETIPDLDEAEVLVELLDQLGLPAWFSYSVDGDRTRAGQPIDEAFGVAASSRAVFAVGVNCCAPADVRTAVERAVAMTGRPAVAYPNGGETWDAVNRRWAGDGSFDPHQAAEWAVAGARYVGGCCRVGPDDIRAVAEDIRAVAEP